MTKAADFVKEGSQDIAFAIFGYFDAQTLAQCCKVSKQWKAIASDNRLWEKMFPALEVPQGVPTKQFIDRHGVKSKEEIAERAQEFFNKVVLNQPGTFTCKFPFNPQSTVEAKIQCGKNNTLEIAPMQEVCIFMKKLAENEMSPIVSSNAIANNCTHSSKSVTINLPHDEKNIELAARVEKVLSDRVESLQPGFFEWLFG